MQMQIYRKPLFITCAAAIIVSSGNASADRFDELKTYFTNANLASEPEIVDCTLSGGSKTTCFQITVRPEPKTHTPGPWCPQTITDSADHGGIWLENGEVHEVSGEFVENMATFYADPEWQLFDAQTGRVNVTDTYEKCAGAAKPNVEPEYQQHCVECQLDYIEEDKAVTYTIPLTPVAADQTSGTGSYGSGIAFDGVRLDASAPVADILGNYTLAPFDDCGGHVNLHVGYHYHAATDCLEKAAVATDNGSAVGLAMDGHLILARLMNNGSVPEDLDQCGGHTTDQLGYHYHAGEEGSNAILKCLVAQAGCVSETGSGECDASATAGNAAPGGGRPDFAAAAKKLDVSETELMQALGAPPPDFEKAASALGVSVEELQQAIESR